MQPQALGTFVRRKGLSRFWPAGGYAIALAMLLGSRLLSFGQWRPASAQEMPTLTVRALIYVLWLVGAVIFLLALRASRRAARAVRAREEHLRILVDSLKDYAIYMMDPQGRVLSWDGGAQHISGYSAQEMIGQNFARLFPAEDIKAGKPENYLRTAADSGRFEHEGWRVRKDGSCFWASSTITALFDDLGALSGFCKVTADRSREKQVEMLENDRRHVLEMVAQNQPLAQVVAHLMRTVERQYPEAIATVLLLRDGKIEPATAASLPAEFMQAMGDCADELITALNSTTAVCDLTAAASPGRLHELELKEGIRAALRVPISSGAGRILGAVVNYYLEPHPGNPDEVELLKTVAGLAAVAIEHQQLNEQLAYQAHHDSLTGLPNRTLLEDRMRQALAQAARSGKLVGLIFLDLDRFKEINDSLGHEAGDEMLRELSRRFAAQIRQSDTLARMGGDEFMVLLPDLHDRSDAVRIARKILAVLEAPVVLAGHEYVVSASLGVAVHPQDGRDAGELQKNADTAMYQAKRGGRNRIECFAGAMGSAATEKLELEAQLRRAVERGEFELHYQPELDRDGRIIAMEALVRWRHPRLGLMPPAKFIGLAEETGLILSLGRWVLREACRQNKAWQDAGFECVRVAVNVSALQFPQADFVQMLSNTLTETGLDPRWLELELTESALMQDARTDLGKLARIRAMGTCLAVDDFGTGYSSLAYLQKLPIDTLKIDGSFVRAITAPDSEAPLVRAMISLAHSLHMRVIAEGVETPVQRQVLQDLGCDGIQGYLITVPLPAAQIAAFLRPLCAVA